MSQSDYRATRREIRDEGRIARHFRRNHHVESLVGFISSHSMGKTLLGLVIGYFALAQLKLLFDSNYLSAVEFLILVGLIIPARRNWFSAPSRGIGFSLACYLAAQVLARMS